VTIAGSVSNHATVFADTADIRENATFARDLTLRARDVIFKGRVLGRLDIAAPRVTLGGTVGGDVVLAGEDLVLQPGTRIGGNLRYTSSKTLTIGPDVTVAGEVIRPPAPGAGSARMFDPALALVLGAVWTLALVFLLVMPAHVEGATAQIRRSWGRCLLVGSISGTGAPLLAGGLAATLVGIPLALALIAGAGLAFAMAPAVTGLWIGTRIIPGGDGTARRTRILRTFAGLAVLSLIGWIPAVGPGLLLFLFLTGAGGVWVHTLSGGIQRPPAVGGCPPLP
jgi:cytoskeletal protein CcmA (bactofilin family)